VDFRSFSECALILLGNPSDFDSAIEAAGQPPSARRDEDRTRLGQRIGQRSRSPSVGYRGGRSFVSG